MNQIAGPRSLSRLIAESLRKYIVKIKKDEREAIDRAVRIHRALDR